MLGKRKRKNENNNQNKNISNIHSNIFMKFVPPEDELKTIFNNLKTSDIFEEKISKLLTSINYRDIKNEIFLDPNCHIFAQMLYERGRISREQSLTVLMYISILQEHTDLQPLRAEDQDLKWEREVKVHDITKICDEFIFKDYLKHLNEVLEDIGCKQIVPSILIERFKDLNSIERFFFSVALPESLKVPEDFKYLWSQGGYRRKLKDLGVILSEKELFLAELLIDSKLILCIPTYQAYIIPSISCITLILKHIREEGHIEFTSIFGKIDHDTLHEEIHANQLHPLNAYSIHTQSNLVNPHGCRIGPFSTLIHDILHVANATFAFSVTDVKFYIDEVANLFKGLRNLFKGHKFYSEMQSTLENNFNVGFEFLNDLLDVRFSFLPSLFGNEEIKINFFEQAFERTNLMKHQSLVWVPLLSTIARSNERMHAALGHYIYDQFDDSVNLTIQPPTLADWTNGKLEELIGVYSAQRQIVTYPNR